MKLYYAELQTRHFTYRAVDKTKKGARAAIVKLWDENAAECEGQLSWADYAASFGSTPEEMREDEIGVREMRLGVADYD